MSPPATFNLFSSTPSTSDVNTYNVFFPGVEIEGILPEGQVELLIFCILTSEVSFSLCAYVENI
jgi:hypothetical protein